MPRALDPKQLTPDYDPTRSGTEFHFGNLRKDMAEMWPLILEQLADNLLPQMVDAFEALTGWDLSTIKPLLDELDLDFSSPEAFLMSLVDVLLALPAVLISLAAGLLSSGAGFMGSDSPLNLLNAFNLLPTNLLGQVNHSLIGTGNTNLIADPNFMDAGSFTGLDEWFHVLGFGFGGTGAAHTTADGTSKELLGNLIPVSEGQVMPISGKAKWSGLAGTGNPIALAVTGYLSGGAADQQVIASHNTTPATTDWISLSGSYTVPANVESIRTRLVVGSTATAGDVWFSSMSATKTQSLFQRLIAGTDPGDNLTNDIEGLFSGVITNALSLLTKTPKTDHDDLLTTLGGPDLPTIEDRWNSFLDIFSPLNADNINQGNISDARVGGLTSINDNLVTRLLNISGSGFGHTDASDALLHNRSAMTDTSARLAQLELLLTGGVSDGDDFERVSSTSLGTGWLHYKTGAGKWATPNGHDAEWMSSGNDDCDFLEIRNAGQIRTTTDLQHVAMVMGSKAEKDLFDNCGGNAIWLRISDNTTSLANITGIRCYYDAVGGATIDRYVAGVRTVLVSLPAGTLTPPGPGSSVWGEAGTPGVARYFRSGIGTSTLLSVTEVGTASGVGAAFRRWGHGGHAEGLVFVQANPGSVHQITCKDQVT